MKTIYECEECNFRTMNSEEGREHKWQFHTPFRRPCLLNEKPYKGFCTLKEHYESCQTPNILGKVIKNNWMCWRDGILYCVLTV